MISKYFSISLSSLFLIQAREKQKLIYVSPDFFEFICIVETVFLANANTGMMIAYHDGSLFEKITEALGSNETIMNLFKSYLKIEHYPDKNIKSFLYTILRKFKNIRGRWFVNNIRG